MFVRNARIIAATARTPIANNSAVAGRRWTSIEHRGGKSKLVSPATGRGGADTSHHASLDAPKYFPLTIDLPLRHEGYVVTVLASQPAAVATAVTSSTTCQLASQPRSEDCAHPADIPVELYPLGFVVSMGLVGGLIGVY